MAALAAGAVAVLKPVQTGVAPGEPGDLADVARLVPGVTTRELARYPEPLAPATAARRSGRPPVRPEAAATAAVELAADHDLVLIEGAGGLLVRFDDDGARSPMSPRSSPRRCSSSPPQGSARSTTPH